VPSSADVAAALKAGAAEVIRAAVAWHGPVVVLIDGRSGAGKSTIAAEVSHALDADLLALDSVYPGWDGLAAGAEVVRARVLAPLAGGRRASWPEWDWTLERSAPDERSLEPGRGLVVEGSGALTPGTRELSQVQVWVESPESSRRARAFARDGDAYRPHWERWAAQEEEHLRRHDPRALASIIIDVP
jgi:uridine kinase